MSCHSLSPGLTCVFVMSLWASWSRISHEDIKLERVFLLCCCKSHLLLPHSQIIAFLALSFGTLLAAERLSPSFPCLSLVNVCSLAAYITYSLWKCWRSAAKLVSWKKGYTLTFTDFIFNHSELPGVALPLLCKFKPYPYGRPLLQQDWRGFFPPYTEIWAHLQLRSWETYLCSRIAGSYCGRNGLWSLLSLTGKYLPA